MPIATKLSRVVTCGRMTPLSNPCELLICGHVTNIKLYICTSAVHMTTKLDRVVTCSGGTQPSKTRDLLITWSRDK